MFKIKQGKCLRIYFNNELKTKNRNSICKIKQILKSIKISKSTGLGLLKMIKCKKSQKNFNK